ncbi:hypothetical protein ACS0TY_024073 [Phlomoides rotata]
MSHKRRIGEYETVTLTEECSAILQAKLPPKLKDPGSFTLPCKIGKEGNYTALCDLGASINLMPLSLFKTLGLGELKPTTMNLQLADRTVTYPRGIVEDVLVKVDKFIFPVDFVVLDMVEDRAIPLILGRPFLATGGAMIDVRNGELTLDVAGEKVSFNIFKAMKFHSVEEDEDEDEDLKYRFQSIKKDGFDEEYKQVEVNSKIKEYDKIWQVKESSKLEIKDLGIGKNAKFGEVFSENSPNSSNAPYASGGLNKRSRPHDLIEEPDGLACGCFNVLKKGGSKKFQNKERDDVT